ncbi:MAG: dethiobiotin synthase [Gammaproteobacteria bacterium]|nr:dethiobiotin synthase [Gammaproteobacteria bacterium]
MFADPVAPHIAAGRGGTVMEFDVIDAARGRLAARADAVVVEGVGGWLVPLAPGLDVETLARRLALPVVLVVGLRLGCINHALLSARAIESSGCAFAGWIANHLADDFPEAGENIAAIRAGIDAPLLAEVAFSLEGPAKARRKGSTRSHFRRRLPRRRARLDCRHCTAFPDQGSNKNINALGAAPRLQRLRCWCSIRSLSYDLAWRPFAPRRQA